MVVAGRQARKKCPFCQGMEIDYKDPAKLRPFISPEGAIYSRRRTGCCSKHQHALSRAIKRARHLALLPFCGEHVYKTGGVGIRD